MSVKVRIKHQYRGVPYEIEIDSNSIKTLDLLDDLLNQVYSAIDRILEKAKVMKDGNTD